MKYYFAADGYPALEINYELHVISDFLQGDIQSSLYGVNEYISACDDVLSGKVPVWEGTGNAHTVTIKTSGVNICNEYTEEEIDISSIGEFRKYLEGWKELLLSKNDK
ncbi:hypothetical protein H1224_22145 [Pectobacterium aroidearum]|uniref:hypothetical protein n=1 Tax=Pectobacterium aroidearum TaxID=1201031 RepID=UPI0015F5729C|nr:hypothetical protein [Pectobacterium aroidearum]MBA5603736.1 hypothetical protein [Pectobacterium aroidearum]